MSLLSDREELRSAIWEAYMLSVIYTGDEEDLEKILDALQAAYSLGLDKLPDFPAPSDWNPPF